jgi:hypothetical protein
MKKNDTSKTIKKKIEILNWTKKSGGATIEEKRIKHQKIYFLKENIFFKSIIFKIWNFKSTETKKGIWKIKWFKDKIFKRNDI